MINLAFPFLLVFPLLASPGFALSPRRQRHDNELMCLEDQFTPDGTPYEHNLPLPGDFRWPYGHPRTPATYKRLLDLCAWQPEGPPSVGCNCFRSKDNRPEEASCDPEYAEPALWRSHYLHELCMKTCRCPVKFGSLGESEEEAEKDIEATLNIPNGVFENSDIDMTDIDEDESPTDNPLFQFGSFETYEGDQIKRLSLPSKPAKCRRRCSKSTFKCAGGGRGCVCEARPAGLGVWSVAGCMSLVSGLGRRDESPVCPCNASYVSRGCCGLEGGLIWEDARQKLGVLDLEV